MGQVYRATDTKLGRVVAIKVLPIEVAENPTRLARFRREAQLLASLNHPNVGAIYGLDEAHGQPFLVLELVEGEDLAERLRRGKLPVDEAIAVARQVVDALEEAHEKGIVHRDLKPANIKLTPEGKVKVLDFGLAKVHEREGASGSSAELSQSPTLAADGTREGVILGTVAYMPPEQARGRSVDKRADIWAFGVVLFEALTGRRLFEGETVSDMLAAVLTREPDWALLPPSTPARVRRLLERCLERDPRQRLRDIGEARIALDEVGTHPLEPQAAPETRRFKRVIAVLAPALAVATTGLVWAFLTRRPPAVPRVTAIRQLTHDRTVKDLVHTDGTRVYYTAYVVDSYDASSRLLQVPLTGGDPVPLESPFRRPYIQDILPSRNELLVEDDVRGSFLPGPLWLLSTTGGSPRPLGSIEASHSAWSDDGQRIVYANGKDVLVARSDGSGSRRLLTAPAPVLFPRLSPDGQRLRYTVREEDGTVSLWEATADGGGAHPLLPGWRMGDTAQPAGCGRWTPDGRFYVFSAIRDGETALWVLGEKGLWPWSGPPSSDPSKLTTGPMSYFDPTLSPDGRTLFALGSPPSMGGELVRYDAAGGLFAPFLGGLSARDVEFSRDGRWIAYVRHPDGTLWRSHPDGTDLRQLTFAPQTASMPRWSPDGRRIAYMSLSPGEKWESLILAADGGKPQPVTAQPGAMDPTWSPDGTRLALGFSTTPSNGTPIQVADLRSGKALAIPGSEGLSSPRWSPDGRSIVALSNDYTRLALYDFATGRWRDLLVAGAPSFGYPSWTHDGKRIQMQNGSSVIRVRVADGQVEPVASFERVPLVVTPGSWGWLGIAPDDSPVVLRRLSGGVEVYALDVEWR
jgi:serine/threonine protein kinase/Tol biopolymer transport system component